MISRRVSTARIAEEILVMDLGQVIAQDSGEARMDAEGRNARLYSIQAEGNR